MRMRKTILFLAVATLSLSLTGCQNFNEEINASLQSERESLQSEISSLEDELDELNATVTEKKIETDTAKYVITFNIRQSHISLDISEHIKDSLNDISIQIPVDKEYYDSVEVGDVIDDSFRIGSLIMKGSFGSWKVTVEDKEIQ